MLCKILERSTGVAPIAWRVPLPAAAGAAAWDPHPAGPGPSELAVLQARVSELQAGIDQKVKESFEAGLAEGERVARAHAESAVREVLERATQSVAELVRMRSQIQQQSEAELVKLALEVARRVLHRELTIDPLAVSALVKAALEKLQGQVAEKVRVHPEHEEIVRSSLRQFGLASAVQVIADPSRPPGTLIFELESGNLDASIEMQLREIEHGLADRLES